MRWTIGKKLGAGFGTALLILVIVSVTAYLNVAALIEASKWNAHTHEVIAEIEYLISALKDAETGERGYIITGEDRYLEPYQSAIGMIDAKTKQARELTSDNPNQQRRLDTIEPLIAAELNVLKEIIDLRRNKGFEAASKVVLEDRGKKAMDKIRKVVDEMQDEENALMKQRSKDTSAAAKATKSVIVIGTLLAAVLLSLIAVVITRGITKPLQLMLDRLNEIAGAAGDLTATIPVASKDEVGDLARAFNNMIAGLKTMVTKILANSQNVSASSQQLSAAAQQSNASVQQVSSAIQQLARGSQTQARGVEEARSVMEQLNVSISQTAQSTQQAASASSQTSLSAQKGAETVQEAVATMDRIDHATTLTSEAVMKLGKRSEQMAEIVDVISNVADQTNLLALNAAIEAARAGEAGRGFAVVAEEVRKLAENSARSSTEIGKLIKETTSETESAVKNMEATAKEVTSGKKTIIKAGNALEEISHASQNVATMLQQISAASQQMSSGAKQVVKSVEDVAAIAEEASASTQQASASTQQMVATMQEMASSAQSLAQMGIDLNNLVAEFKTGEEGKTSRPEPPAPKFRQAASIEERLSEARKKMGQMR